MAALDVINQKGEKVSEIDLPDAIYNVPVKASLLHDVVTMQRAARRSGTASVKNRSDVKGSTRKLFRQKGTGRARRGDIKSPLLRGGGVVFGPTPRSYEKKIPKKVRKLALKMALSSKYQEDALRVIDQFEVGQIKTKDFAGILESIGVRNVLIVIDRKDVNLELSSRNIPNVKVMRSEGLNVYDVLKYSHLILVEPSLKDIEGRLLT